MNFSRALDRIKWGQPMTRSAWGDPAVYVYRPGPDEQLFKRLPTGNIPWSPAVEDIMASDWADVQRID